MLHVQYVLVAVGVCEHPLAVHLPLAPQSIIRAAVCITVNRVNHFLSSIEGEG